MVNKLYKFTFIVAFLIIGISLLSSMGETQPYEPTKEQINACKTLMWVQKDLQISVDLGLIDKQILADKEITDRCKSWGITG